LFHRSAAFSLRCGCPYRPAVVDTRTENSHLNMRRLRGGGQMLLFACFREKFQRIFHRFVMRFAISPPTIVLCVMDRHGPVGLILLSSLNVCRAEN
jgi:hypothetical protein